MSTSTVVSLGVVFFPSFSAFRLFVSCEPPFPSLNALVQQEDEIRNLWKTIDTDGDGKLTREEMAQALGKQFKELAPGDIQKARCCVCNSVDAVSHWGQIQKGWSVG